MQPGAYASKVHPEKEQTKRIKFEKGRLLRACLRSEPLVLQPAGYLSGHLRVGENVVLISRREHATARRTPRESKVVNLDLECRQRRTIGKKKEMPCGLR